MELPFVTPGFWRAQVQGAVNAIDAIDPDKGSRLRRYAGVDLCSEMPESLGLDNVALSVRPIFAKHSVMLTGVCPRRF